MHNIQPMILGATSERFQRCSNIHFQWKRLFFFSGLGASFPGPWPRFRVHMLFALCITMNYLHCSFCTHAPLLTHTLPGSRFSFDNRLSLRSKNKHTAVLQNYQLWLEINVEILCENYQRFYECDPKISKIVWGTTYTWFLLNLSDLEFNLLYVHFDYVAL